MTLWATLVGGIFLVLCVLGLRKARRRGPLAIFVTTLLLSFVFFEVVFPGYTLPGGSTLPGLAMVAVGSSTPLPLPATALWTFMLLIAIGGLVVVTADDAWMREFFAPILSFLRGEDESIPSSVRLALLYGLVPLAVGFAVLCGFMPSAGAPIESRQAHPTIRYDDGWQNPLREPSNVLLQAFASEQSLEDLGAEELRTAFREAMVHEGRHLYGKYCVPCHGAKTDGTGLMAWGYRLQPIDFTDPGTLATLVEGYAYQRIVDGGIGLPASGSPWDSAMPRWKGDLDEEQIAKILLAEYDLAGVTPRLPEKHE